MPRPAAPPILLPDDLVRIGRALYGDQWQSEIARATGKNDRHIRQLASGDRNIVDVAFVGRLAELCLERGDLIAKEVKPLAAALRRAKKR